MVNQTPTSKTTVGPISDCNSLPLPIKPIYQFTNLPIIFVIVVFFSEYYDDINKSLFEARSMLRTLSGISLGADHNLFVNLQYFNCIE